MDALEKRRELEALQSKVRQLESELESAAPPGATAQPAHYLAYHVLAGFVLGMFGAVTSLLFNVVGAALVGEPPLKLIQVYLTFPLGASALKVDNGIILATGCCLYIATGMILGIPFQIMLTRWLDKASFATRLAWASALAVGLWIMNFYLILSWLQPLLFGGNWIVQEIPWWVAALTHLVFGWTMLLVQPMGTYIPYQQPSEAR